VETPFPVTPCGREHPSCDIPEHWRRRVPYVTATALDSSDTNTVGSPRAQRVEWRNIVGAISGLCDV
jgi:hypothetical protein